MKRVSLFVAAVVCCLSLGAQTQMQTTADESWIRERMYVATDKDNYLSGEIVWMKLITTDSEGMPLSFSKVGYIELVDESESRLRERIELHDGVGEGTMVLPSNLPTGYYRIVGYTRWMQNEGPEVFFEKRVGVVNPALAEVPRSSAPADQAPSLPEVGLTGNLTISSDRSVYPVRSKVNLEISGIPADIHTLSVSVTAADPTGGFTDATLTAWREALPGISDRFSGEYEAEYEGATITGKLISTETDRAAYSSSVMPLVAFPGNDINLFGGSIDEMGRVVFHTNRTSGFNEIVTTMRGDNTNSWRIDVDDPFSQTHLTRPLPSFPLEDIDSEAILKQSIAMQLQYSFVNDSLMRRRKLSPTFFERPTVSYKMDEWKRFATMREVMTEFVQFAHFDRVNGKRYLVVINRDFGTTKNYAMVLLDGVPIIDHEIIYNYNPLLITRIDVYNEKYLFGNNVFFGIVALYTDRNSYPELQPDPFTQILPYTSTQARRLFYSVDYTDPAARTSRVADYRHTLYWDADIETNGNDRANVSFYTSDLTGDYRVLVEGITASGKPMSAVFQIGVK